VSIELHLLLVMESVVSEWAQQCTDSPILGFVAAEPM